MDYWINTPMEEIYKKSCPIPPNKREEDGPPESVGRFMWQLQDSILDMYYGEVLSTEEEREELECEGTVPLMLDGHIIYKSADELTLADIPLFIEAYVSLLKETEDRRRKEQERYREKKRVQRNARARERRLLKNLGEW